MDRMMRCYMGGGGSPPKPPPVAPAPTKSQAATVGNKRTSTATRPRGKSSTIVAGLLGGSDDIRRKTLLGS